MAAPVSQVVTLVIAVAQWARTGVASTSNNCSGSDRQVHRCWTNRNGAVSIQVEGRRVGRVAFGHGRYTPASSGREHLPGGRPPIGTPGRFRCCSHDAGSLRAADAGQTVTLAGWVARRRDHGGVIFIDLRDASAFPRWCSGRERAGLAHRLRAEFCVAVTGVVEVRPEATPTPRSPPADRDQRDALTVLGRRAAAVPARRARR